MADIGVMFSKSLPMIVKHPEREDRKSHIKVTIETVTLTTPVHRKELVVRLTDASDLFFLYTLHLGEEDFQSLKSQQGLLVDFAAFPQKFIDLLQLCLQEEHKEVPKFIIHLVCSGNMATDKGVAHLDVIETNPFKHLIHLSLRLLPGTDSDVKKYLAECLKMMQNTNCQLQQRLDTTESDLTHQLRQAREALSSRTIELDSLKTELNTTKTSLNARYSQEVTAEKERALQAHTSMQQRYEQERRELEETHTAIVKQQNKKLHEQEAMNKELTDQKYKSESTIRELNVKLASLEEEHHRTKSDLQTVRKENMRLDNENHEQEKLINQLRTRLAVVDQEIKDKEQLLSKSSDLLGTEQGQKRKYEEELEKKQRHISKLESSIKTMTDELVKANEIIKKLQAELKNYHTKLKLRNQVTTEQEKLLSEKTQVNEKLKKEKESVEGSLKRQDEEMVKIKDELEAKSKKLEESKQLLKTNENVINWLNKQVTEMQLGGHTQVRHGNFEIPSGTGAFRPTHTALHNYSGSTALSDLPSRTTVSASSSGVVHFTARQPLVQYNPGLPRSNHPMPANRPATVPENRQQVAPPDRSTGRPNLSGEPLLDAKYLQRADDVPLRSAGEHSLTPTPLQFGRHTPITPTLQHPAPRFGKEPAAVSKPATKPSQAPPLASAYFPGQTKVS